MKLGLTLAVLLAAPTAALSEAWTLVPEKSEILVHTDRAGFLSFAGHRHVIRADTFSGTFRFEESDPAALELTVEIDARSLVVANKDLDRDKVARVQAEMNSSVLEIDEYETISFRATEARVKESDADGWQLEVNGDLLLHGVTRSVSMAFLLTDEGDRLRMVGSTEIAQKDFGISPVSIGAGAVKVKNEVEIAFVLVLHPESSKLRAGDADAN